MIHDSKDRQRDPYFASLQYRTRIITPTKMKTVKYKKLPEVWLLVVTLFTILLGYLIGSSVRRVYEVKTITLYSASENFNSSLQFASSIENFKSSNVSEIYVASNPCRAERLSQQIFMAHSDFSLHVRVGNETVRKPNYLLALAVGIQQKDIVNKIVSKFSEDFTIILFHYDGKTSEWDQFEWSQRAIHISALQQTKWWYAKRFLHPDIVAQYEYIFMCDEDLGVEHFNAEEGAGERLKNCPNPFLPPGAGFVEIMAPVFSRKSWNCVWHMIQNDLVHGWGLDLAFWRCVEGESIKGKLPRVRVWARSFAEWKEFENRMKEAEKQHPQKL